MYRDKVQPKKNIFGVNLKSCVQRMIHYIFRDKIRGFLMLLVKTNKVPHELQL